MEHNIDVCSDDINHDYFGYMGQNIAFLSAKSARNLYFLFFYEIFFIKILLYYIVFISELSETINNQTIHELVPPDTMLSQKFRIEQFLFSIFIEQMLFLC